MHVSGIHPVTMGFNHKADKGNIDQRCFDSSLAIASSFVVENDIPRREERDPEEMYVKLAMAKNNSIVPCRVPHTMPYGWPESRELYPLSNIVKLALLDSDERYLRKTFGFQFVDRMDLVQYVWPDMERYEVYLRKETVLDSLGTAHFQQKWERYSPEVWYEDRKVAEAIPTLRHMILRKFSSWRMACGKVNGRMPVTAAMSNLFPRKFVNSVLNMNRPTHKPPDCFDKEIRPLVPQAMDLLYHKMGIHKFGTEHSRISFLPVKQTYLGASSGLNKHKHFTISDPGFENAIFVSAKGKKIELLEADMYALLDLLRTGSAPPVYWNVTPKNENFFSWLKQLSDDDYDAWKNKCRLFVIPSSLFVHAEKMGCRVRHYKERGWTIAIGHCNAKGGVDKLAKMLGINKKNCRQPLIDEGDAKNFDQTVLEFFVNLYFSTMLIHEVPGTPDYELKKKIVRWLLQNMICRLTRLFGSNWGWVRGQVPSGCWNTSHMDSWVMAMYFILFCIHTLINAPEDIQVELEDVLYNIIRNVVYGDDFLTNKGEGLAAIWFSVERFAVWCQKYLGVTIRDIYSGLTFVSDVFMGFITRRGANFLKHQFIENPCKDEGQCDFLPFRESQEFMIRAIWGRETRSRDAIDVLMSCIGHAYGTYAANPDAYDRLMFLYEALIQRIGVRPRVALRDVFHRMNYDDMKKVRQMGIEPEDLLKGFPSWKTLVQKNILDWNYLDNIQDDIEQIDDWY
jgi:hypothetical protein